VQRLKISDVFSGKSANRAGVETGDVIQTYNGQTITSDDDLSKALHEAPYGGKMVVYRDGKILSIDIMELPLGITTLQFDFAPENYDLNVLIDAMASQTIMIGMTSGARYRVSQVFLHEEKQLRKAHGLRATAATNLGGVSTGIGFWGSPEWALGGAFALGILEGVASGAAAKKGISQLEEASHVIASAQRDGTFVSVQDIQNIAFPQPSLWRGIVKHSVLKSYAHSGEPFVLVRTTDDQVIHLAWEKVESFLQPSPLVLSDDELMTQYSITFDGIRYSYEGHRYDKLADAINYARVEYAKR